MFFGSISGNSSFNCLRVIPTRIAFSNLIRKESVEFCDLIGAEVFDDGWLGDEVGEGIYLGF